MSSLLTCLLLCCLALASPAMARSPAMALDDGWRSCGAPPSATASLHNLLKRQQLLCLERELVLPATPQSPQVLVLSALAASTLWLDGLQIAGNGQPAAQAAGEIAGQIDLVVPLAPAQLAQGTHHLRLLLSTQQVPARLDAPFYGVFLQDQQAYQAAQAWRTLLPLLLAGALASVSLLFFALNLLYQRRLHWVVFTALCLAASLLLVAETWRSLAGYAYPLHSVRLHAINLLTWLFAALLPLYFFCAYHRRHWLLAAALILAGVAVAGALPAHFDNQCRSMFVTGLMLSLFLNLAALWRRLPGSRAGTAIALVSCAMYQLAGNGFAEGGFALVVCFLLLPLCFQLLSQLMRDRQKAARASQLENQLLRKSLQPHFLMNSLSLISELNAQSPQAAEDFIVALGAGFRMLNDYAQQPSIALAQELALCHNYLAIMSTRLQQPCILETEGDTSAIIVPPATLLTALENAFSHHRYRQGATFRLEIERNGHTDILRLLLPAGESRPHAGSGIGERYIRSSLQAVFGRHARYDITLQPGGRQLTLTLPAAS
ncbi:histidine kinase [Janthinobacterium sp. Mn2066]|uniref:histidine kinase n=1 Tax=Janthinobacterium sp. Mn2066 TaxID=3395264 RepID=UPI003BBC7E6C